jgi:hypothetical protein
MVKKIVIVMLLFELALTSSVAFYPSRTYAAELDQPGLNTYKNIGYFGLVAAELIGLVAAYRIDRNYVSRDRDKALLGILAKTILAATPFLVMIVEPQGFHNWVFSPAENFFEWVNKSYYNLVNFSERGLETKDARLNRLTSLGDLMRHVASDSDLSPEERIIFSRLSDALLAGSKSIKTAESEKYDLARIGKVLINVSRVIGGGNENLEFIIRTEGEASGATQEEIELIFLLVRDVSLTEIISSQRETGEGLY